MFQFARLSLVCLWIQQIVKKVNLFGNLRIYAQFPLPEAFRRLNALLRLWVPRYPPYALSFLNLAAQGRLKELLI